MANNPKFANVAVNAEADALSDLLDSGYMRIYDGSQPANAGVAVSTQVLLAELRFNATFSPAAVAGLITANAITQDSSADAGGTATWFRALKSDGSTVVMDGSVGTSSADAIINANPIVAGTVVQCTAFTIQVSKG